MYSGYESGSLIQEKQVRLSKVIGMSVLAAGLCAGGAFAQDDPDFGFDFVTIGDPGNRETLDEELGELVINRHLGAVDYEFRMATLEVTVGQYFEFVQVYHPYYTANTGNPWGFSDFTGGDILVIGGTASIEDGVSPEKPINVNWRYATRYINWLHNNKVNEEWAFETGVYDTSTYTQNDDGSWNFQEFHNPGARFWIPTWDEWTKAAYWDPKLNSGDGGYHLFPNGSNSQSLPVTERNAGWTSSIYPLDVGQFPDVMSPWGILDMQGGQCEMTEALDLDHLNWRIVEGSPYWDPTMNALFTPDKLGVGSTMSVQGFGSGGIRLASRVRDPGDLNRDWHVDFFDISFFIRRFVAGDLIVDLDADGDLDFDDVVLLLELLG